MDPNKNLTPIKGDSLATTLLFSNIANKREKCEGKKEKCRIKDKGVHPNSFGASLDILTSFQKPRSIFGQGRGEFNLLKAHAIICFIHC